MNEENKSEEKQPLNAHEKQMVLAGNNFAIKLSRMINDTEPGNFFISPVSISYALALAFNGAEGDTKEGIKNTINFDNLSDEQINKSFLSLTNQLTGTDKKVMMEIGNSLWYRQGLTVKNEFKRIATSYYDAGIEGLDFENPASKDIINKWISDKTSGKIKDMISQTEKDATMYLINAIYFKGDWTNKFEKSATKKEPFRLENGKEQPVEMMFAENMQISYLEKPEYSYIELPYGNRQFVMAIILPKEGHRVKEVFNKLDPEILKNLSDGADKISSEIKFPKFKLEYKRTLNDDLSLLGMSRAFSPEAEFPGFFNEPFRYMISRVLHKTFLEVNEEGSEAAAVTIIHFELTSSKMQDPRSVIIDKPFAFFIIEKNTNMILFAGKLMEF